MPKAQRKSKVEEEEDVPLHSTINEEEAIRHQHKLEQTINDLKRSALEPEIREIMGDFILSIKNCCEEIYPPITYADAQKVLHSMGDPYGLAIREQTEEVETMLEVSMPEEDLPETDEMIRWASSMEPLSDKSKNTLTSMMEQISEAHYQAAQAAQNLADLSKKCTPGQLMTIMKFAVRPLVQLEGTLQPIWEHTTSRRKKDLPEEIENRVNLTLLPNPNADSLKRESATSPTLLLAGIVYYQIKKNLGGGCTQIIITSKFGLKPKVVTMCLTGRKYRGGKDTKKGTRLKAPDDSPMASTSNQ